MFILALACPAAIAELVLHFDANTQERDDDAWMNSAGPGGAVPMADDKPALEEGMIDVAGQSFNTKYYTASAPRQVFATPGDEPDDNGPNCFSGTLHDGSLAED